MELRQLRYFVVSADVSSFSKAAEILYTTQPNVSKVIRTLENELGFRLFVRQKTGIMLTAKGRYVYEYAYNALTNIEKLVSVEKNTREELLISSNPSSWMASCFARFYNQHAEESVRFQFYSASVAEIITRITNYRDEIGFVYVMKSQNTPFYYMLEKNELDFVLLDLKPAVVYLGEQHPQYREMDLSKIDFRELKLVQNYPGELNQTNYWNLKDETGADLTAFNTKVVTNSDYVMEELLSTTELANIGSDYITGNGGERNYHRIPLYEQENQICFGYIKRKENALTSWAEHYIEYVREQIKEER